MSSYYGSPGGTYYYGSQVGRPPAPSGFGQPSAFGPAASGFWQRNAAVSGYNPARAAAQTAPPAPAVQYPTIDVNNDPTLARIRALGEMSVQQAEAEAEAARKQIAIGYGDPALTATLFRKRNEDLLAKTKNNPFSTVAELARTYKRRDVFDINRPLSDQSNLFYSSERGRQLALSGEQNLRDRNQAWLSVQQKLQDISQQLLQAKLAAQAQSIQAEQNAWQTITSQIGSSLGG